MQQGFINIVCDLYVPGAVRKGLAVLNDAIQQPVRTAPATRGMQGFHDLEHAVRKAGFDARAHRAMMRDNALRIFRRIGR
jgi:hypothetical protein